MKKTALLEIHQDLGAKIVPFAGYEMPLKYTTIQEEHLAVRNHAGVFDVSHMGQFIIKGKEATQLVQLVCSNDVESLFPGKVMYTCLMNEKGTIVDDMLVYRLFEDKCAEGESAYMLVVNASNIEKDWNHINAQNTFDTNMINISDRTGLLAVQGPKAVELLQSLTEINLKEIPYYHFQKGTFAGLENVLISATGYTGSGGFELYADNKGLKTLWDEIIKLEGIKPIGLGARDTLRLEMGFCLYGNDIDENISPCEAGLNWICKTEKKPSFLGEEKYLAVKQNKNRSYLVGFILNGKRIPRKGYQILDPDDNIIGEVTSGAQSPCLDVPIGMGYVTKGFRKSGTKIQIKINKKTFDATVTKLPFVNL